MGADLYIEKMDREKQYRGFEVSDEAVEAGYFRDCYNSSGLFAVMSETLDRKVSWWLMANQVGLNKKGVLPLANVKVWKAAMQPIIKEFISRPVLYYKDYEKGKTEIPAKDAQEYRDWARRLERLMELAIEKESGIIWSV